MSPPTDLQQLRDDTYAVAKRLDKRHEHLTRNELEVLHECWQLVGALDNIVHMSNRDDELNKLTRILQELSDLWPAMGEEEQRRQIRLIVRAYRIVGNLNKPQENPPAIDERLGKIDKKIQSLINMTG